MKRCILGEHKSNTTGGGKQRAEAIEGRVATGSERWRGGRMEGERGKTWRLMKGEEGKEARRGREVETCTEKRGKNELEKKQKVFPKEEKLFCTTETKRSLLCPALPFPPIFPALSLHISPADGLLGPPSSSSCQSHFLSHSFSPALLLFARSRFCLHFTHFFLPSASRKTTRPK